MKKLVILLAAVALVSSVSVGQMVITKGIKAGLNFATFGGSDAPSGAKYTTQFTGGVFANLSLPFGFSFQPEVLYTVNGYKAGSFTQNVQYLDVPLLIKYSLPAFSIMKPSVYVGPMVGARLGAKASTPDSVTTGSVDNKTAFSDKDVAIVMGAGSIFTVGPVDLVLDIRYTMGIWKIDRPEKMKMYNRGIAVMAGIML